MNCLLREESIALGLKGDPAGLARALEKMETAAHSIPAHVEPATASLFIVSPLSGGRSLLSLFSTHPRTEERIRKLRGLISSPGRASARLA